MRERAHIRINMVGEIRQFRCKDTTTPGSSTGQYLCQASLA